MTRSGKTITAVLLGPAKSFKGEKFNGFFNASFVEVIGSTIGGSSYVFPYSTKTEEFGSEKEIFELP